MVRKTNQASMIFYLKKFFLPQCEIHHQKKNKTLHNNTKLPTNFGRSQFYIFYALRKTSEGRT
jgi:hypothetical protein